MGDQQLLLKKPTNMTEVLTKLIQWDMLMTDALISSHISAYLSLKWTSSVYGLPGSEIVWNL